MDDSVLEYHVLDTVHRHDGQITQKEVAKKLGRGVASVNFALRLLAAKGYIKVLGTGMSPRRIQYHLTPEGLIQKSLLAYNFIRRQSALYDEVRNGLLETLETLRTQRVGSASLYGWTPFTETVLLYLTCNGIQIKTIYVDQLPGWAHSNRVPFRLIEDFEADCDILLLLQPLPTESEDRITIGKLVCFPS